jgi:hypothetical protein
MAQANDSRQGQWWASPAAVLAATVLLKGLGIL